MGQDRVIESFSHPIRYSKGNTVARHWFALHGEAGTTAISMTGMGAFGERE